MKKIESFFTELFRFLLFAEMAWDAYKGARGAEGKAKTLYYTSWSSHGVPSMAICVGIGRESYLLRDMVFESFHIKKN